MWFGIRHGITSIIRYTGAHGHPITGIITMGINTNIIRIIMGITVIGTITGTTTGTTLITTSIVPIRPMLGKGSAGEIITRLIHDPIPEKKELIYTGERIREKEQP
jgi:hypothetical protein